MDENVVQVETSNISNTLEKFLYILGQLFLFLVRSYTISQLFNIGKTLLLVFQIKIDWHLHDISSILLKTINWLTIFNLLHLDQICSFTLR